MDQAAAPTSGEAAPAAATAADAPSAEPAVGDVEALTDEGRTAVALDAALALRLARAARLAADEKLLESSAEEYGDILKECSDRYGQLCPLVAPVYAEYGEVLLRIHVASADALGGGAPAADDDEDGDEDGGGDAGPAGVAGPAAAPRRPSVGVSESKEPEPEVDAPAEAPPAAAEEDLEKMEEEDKEADDLHIALECLESARVIYSRMDSSETVDLALARVHTLLGDALIELEKFDDAIKEAKNALALRMKHVASTDRRLADALYLLGRCHLHRAVDKDVSEAGRRTHLGQTLINYQAAAESYAMCALEAARAAAAAPDAGVDAFVAQLEAEVSAGALSAVYPPGVTTTVAGGARGAAPASASAAGGGAAATAAGAGAPPPGAVEPEIRVFRTVAERLVSGAPAAAVAAADEPAPLEATRKSLAGMCEIVDELLQRMTDIQGELGVSVSGVLADVAAAGSGGGGVTTIGFGSGGPASASAAGGVTTDGFGPASAAAATSDAVPIAPRRKAPAPAPANVMPPAADTVAGAKRSRDGAGEAVAPAADAPGNDDGVAAKRAREAAPADADAAAGQPTSGSN